MRHQTMRHRRDDEGAATLEFAVLSVLFLVLLYGIIHFGLIFAVQQTVSHAAAEGARAAVGAPPGDEETHSEAATVDALGWLADHVSSDEIDAEPGPCAADPETHCVTVSVDYAYGARPILPSFPLFSFATPDVIRTEAVSSIGE